MNMQQLMKQAQQMQEKLQKQMEAIVVDATAGGGMVSVKMNGQKQLLSIQVDPEVFNGGARDMPPELIVGPPKEGLPKNHQSRPEQVAGPTRGCQDSRL